MSLDKERKYIANKVRDLRLARGWTQADLAERLGISQSRLSEIETSAGSFTAEQLIEILRTFNVSITEFAPRLVGDREQEVQNALARFGASHLFESDHVLPSEQLERVHDVIREALLIGRPRLVTAVAPVLIALADGPNLFHIQAQLAQVGYQQRLPWAVDNTLEALERLATGPDGERWRRTFATRQLRLRTFLGITGLPKVPELEDVLDNTVRTPKTLEALRRNASAPSRRWGIVTALQIEDFAKALEDSDVGR